LPTGASVLRRREPAGAPRVTNVELFFDLVYVFAVTQLSHTLDEHLTGRGALELHRGRGVDRRRVRARGCAPRAVDRRGRDRLRRAAARLRAAAPRAHADRRLDARGRPPRRAEQLVLLIALGESILAAGATFARLTWSAGVVTAFVVGFAGTAALWWIYFGHAEEAASAIASAADPARIARAGYADAHGIMVAGVIVVAVGIDLTVAHPTGSASVGTTAVVLGGPALYLAGNTLFKYAVIGRVLPSRVVAVGALAAIAPVAIAADRLVVAALTTLVVASLATR
jgi:low temperature requirement protein LtrA